ncbi:FecCD family ABC transporter permease [Cellulomonas edaphi]|uniref:Iron chelate uptake ABC transporter family permease subunit n=1 Tax=Cellulomonas edaphi TaxID=3053468 RepID=A0ABT7S299_9CELL|nr:iron chelate uptake ABC transporter family permease subunit [Cellulomons edaphi]MDM7829738.1 iron chelate uptake ABC transporter family permease subunit [Cellulomons edaphi]
MTTNAGTDRAAATRGVARGAFVRSLGLVAAVAVLAAVCVLSVMIGAKSIPAGDVLRALLGGEGTHDHSVIWDLRIPRTLVGVVAGAALGVCGALIQAYTRNPLADPGILGVNAGAGIAITTAVAFFGLTSPAGYVWFAFVGAAVVTVLVYLVGSAGPGQATPEKLTLAGVALAAVLGGISQMITLRDPNLFAGMLSWSVGSIGGRSLSLLGSIAPFIGVGLLIALLVARPLNALALGDDLGRSLGARTGPTRTLTIVAVTLLAGGATALAGPIAFVGLMVPHAARWFTGPDQRWIIPYSAVGAAILLLVSDIIGRVILPSGELRVGLVTAFVGGPVLIALARRRTASGL